MSSFALISEGVVAQVAAAQFPVHESLTWVDVSSVSPAPQPGWAAALASGAWTFTAPTVPPPTIAQQVAAALSAGLTITSTSAPAVNGTYRCDSAAQQNFVSVMLYVQVHGVFPGAATTYPWMDVHGTPHVLPSTAAFIALATAIADYASALTQIALAGTGSLPAAAVTIP